MNFQESFQIFYTGLCAIDCGSFPNDSKLSNHFGNRSLKEILKNGILWAVPKKRRTIEKRLSRRFGVEKYFWKPPVPKTNLLICVNCGHNYEAGRLCGKSYCYKTVIIVIIQIITKLKSNLDLWVYSMKVIIGKQYLWIKEKLAKIYSFAIGHCYEKVKLETKEIQEAIQKELGLQPVEENVIVLYDGEKDDKTYQFWKVLKIYLYDI